jgi:hypothetical protein
MYTGDEISSSSALQQSIEHPLHPMGLASKR